MEDFGRETEAVKLTNASLGDLPAEVIVPHYNRDELTPGIVHIGLGNFHRGHQAWYLHRLMQAGQALDWAIIGAGVRPYDAEMRQKLKAQDCLTTLIELDPESVTAEIIGSMIDYLPIEEGNASLIRQMADPSIRIVSLTVTEGGYYLHPASGHLDVDHPDIRHDVAHPSTPRTAFGAMVAALKARRAAGHMPFTAQSCDNLTGNGAILRQSVVGLAQLTDPDLAAWIDQNGAFPNSMVDCIVPATGAAEIEQARSLGIDDAVPVTHENYRQWVIEDAFCADRPNWEDVGATITTDVHGYEAMKIRILNAGHQVLANIGELLSVPTISACMHHATISKFFTKVQLEEIVPYVAPVANMAPPDYLKLIVDRFSNPAIMDTTRRVAFDGSSRHTGFLVPILQDALAANGSIQGLALVEALWARMCAGVREDGSEIEANDPFWDDLNQAALLAKEDPKHWLSQTHIYGELVNDLDLVNSFSQWLRMIWSEGSAAAVENYLSRQVKSSSKPSGPAN